jgi:hypothetical protein
MRISFAGFILCWVQEEWFLHHYLFLKGKGLRSGCTVHLQIALIILRLLM